MRLIGSRRRLTASVVAVAAAGTVVAGGIVSTTTNSAFAAGSASVCGTTAPTTVTVGLWGDFNFKDNGLYAKYEKLCPNINIQEQDADTSGDFWTKLQTELASGSGLPDITGTEIGFVANVVQQHASDFVNFNTVKNHAALKAEFYPWKWNMATTSNGKDTVGLGTDAGPEAMCYRPDLLKKAGLPYKRNAVAKLWKTWPAYIKFGKQYMASKSRDTSSAFIDSANSIFSTAVYQGKEAYDNAKGQPVVQSSDGVKTAWKYASQAATAHITAKLTQWGDDWNKGFANGAFATIPCPTWMMSYIESEAGDAYAGKWDIAPVLPGGATNWGGSWLSVPAKAQHKAAAVALVEWLSAKSQQVVQFTGASASTGGHWPTNKLAAATKTVKNAKSSYFNNAPIGKIFGSIANKMTIPPIGIYDTPIQTAIENGITEIEQKGTSPAQAWQDAMNNVQQVTG